jgi:RecB family exonuclease
MMKTSDLINIRHQPGHFGVFRRSVDCAQGTGMSYRLPVYSPSKLNMYQRCPYSYRRRYIDRSMPSAPPSPAQVRGAVTHQILNLALSDFRDGKGLPDDVSDLARQLLRKYEQLSDGHIEHETQWVSELATFALDHFDTTCEVIVVEDQVEYVHQDRFRLSARADAILKHEDGTFEVVDWKTGSSDYHDSLQYLILFVSALSYVKSEFRAGPQSLRVTAANLQGRRYTRINTSREASLPVWRTIKGLIRSIWRERKWKATRNSLCPYCPLFENGCPLGGPHFLDMGTQPERQPIST